MENKEITHRKITTATRPTKPEEYRDHYYPKTEILGDDEMRITALGTGMPNLRPSQASAAWLVELGNGDTFFFDIGTGCIAGFASTMVSYNRANKVFLSHLHSDHCGDLPALWIGGWVANRATPVYVWGPSGSRPELGTAYFVEHLRKAYTWDIESRHAGGLLQPPSEIIVEEFDYSKTQVVYEENGVTVTAFPAIHILDGPVSFRLDWNGLSFVYSGDTHANRWYVENGQNADVAVHESFITVPQLMEKQGFPEAQAVKIGTEVHTSPEACGEVFAAINPRLAVAYHFFNDWDTAPDIRDALKSTYDGPLVLATDNMVFNVTKEYIKTRMMVAAEDIWPPESAQEAAERDEVMHFGGRGWNYDPDKMSEWLVEGQLHD
ncbi:MAG: guanitoxin biosynthesis MBL fold metallo-hydrolase GntH [Acidimicrobiia bacterium]|nr:guanitoxin biosynthesis MBL fold metallo-hydrolase GntH [Acidimicrobiia bacterium]